MGQEHKKDGDMVANQSLADQCGLSDGWVGGNPWFKTVIRSLLYHVSIKLTLRPSPRSQPGSSLSSEKGGKLWNFSHKIYTEL